jgi:hypothetical protein
MAADRIEHSRADQLRNERAAGSACLAGEEVCCAAIDESTLDVNVTTFGQL